MQALAKGFKPASYGGVELWIAPAKPRSGPPTLSVARMNDQLLLIGSRKTLEATIDRSQSDTGRFISPLLAQAARFSQTKDLWVVATQLPDPLASLFVPLDTSAKGFEGANCSGRRIVCVAASSGTVKSTTRMPPRRMPSTRVDSVSECVAMML